MKDGRDTHAYSIPDEIISSIMIAHTNTKSIMRTDDTEFINISGGVLQGDTLSPFLFIIYLDYVLKKALYRNIILGLPSLREGATDIQKLQLQMWTMRMI